MGRDDCQVVSVPQKRTKEREDRLHRETVFLLVRVVTYRLRGFDI